MLNILQSSGPLPSTRTRARSPPKRRANLWGLWVCVVAVIAIGAVSAPASYAAAEQPQPGGLLLAAPFPGSQLTGVGSVLFKREVGALMREGIAPERATESIAAQAELARVELVPRLLAALGRLFGGVWFEPTQARLHIGVVSPRARRLASAIVARTGVANDVAMTTVRSTWDQMLIAQERWNRRLGTLFARAEVETSLAPQHNAVAVTLTSSVPVSERAAIEREASVDAVRVLVAVAPEPKLTINADSVTSCERFSTARPNAFCEKPITAGVYIRSPTRACTGGPLATSSRDRQATWMLTAGHCLRRSGTRARWSSTNRLGQSLELGLYAQAVFSASGDVGAIRVNNPGNWVEPGATPVFAVTAEWLKTEEIAYSVLGEKTPAVGEENCVEGQVSGGLCGRIRSTTATFNYGFVIRNVVEEENVTSEEGDSGGPVIASGLGGYYVEGTVIGTKGTRPFNTVYMPIATSFSVLNRLDLELLTVSNETRPRANKEEEEENEKIEQYEKEQRNITEAEQKEEEELGEREEKEQEKRQKEELEAQEKREKEEKEAKEHEESGLATILFLAGKEESEWTGKTTGEPVFEAVGGTKVRCTSAKLEGTLKSDKDVGTLHSDFEGCEDVSLGTKCNSRGDATSVILFSGWWKSVIYEKEPELGAALLFEPGEVSAECSTVKVVIKGNVLCPVAKINTLEVNHEFHCEGERGKTKHSEYYNGKREKERISTLLMTVSGKVEEAAGIISGSLAFKEQSEIMG
jgi:hypothetical protein